MSKLNEDIEKAQKQLDKLKNKQDKQYKNIGVLCAKCGHGNKVKDITIRQHQYYVEPYGCTGGDYWTLGTNPDRSFICGKCNIVNRMFGYEDDSIYWILKPFLKHETVYELEEENWINNHD